MGFFLNYCQFTFVRKAFFILWSSCSLHCGSLSPIGGRGLPRCAVSFDTFMQIVDIRALAFLEQDGEEFRVSIPSLRVVDIHRGTSCRGVHSTSLSFRYPSLRVIDIHGAFGHNLLRRNSGFDTLHCGSLIFT